MFLTRLIILRKYSAVTDTQNTFDCGSGEQHVEGAAASYFLTLRHSQQQQVPVIMMNIEIYIDISSNH